MAELDTILVTNPMKEEFTVNFNGEPYSIKGGESKSFPEFLAFHISKHLTDKMLGVDVEKAKKAAKDNPYNPKVGQLTVYDNAQRRIYLYDVLGSKEKVEACINAHPFKGFIGEIDEYDAYVEKQTSKVAEKAVDETEEQPTPKTRVKKS